MPAAPALKNSVERFYRSERPAEPDAPAGIDRRRAFTSGGAHGTMTFFALNAVNFFTLALALWLLARPVMGKACAAAPATSAKICPAQRVICLHRADRSLETDPAIVERIDAVGERQKFTFCSAISSASFCSRNRVSTLITSLTKTGESPADGSSITSSRGPPTSALAMPSIFRWPPDRLPASARRRSARPERPHRGPHAFARPRLRHELRADQDILFDGEARKTSSLGHEGDAATDALIGAKPRDVFAGEFDAAGPDVDQFMIALSSVVLPAPLAPSRTQLALP